MTALIYEITKLVFINWFEKRLFKGLTVWNFSLMLDICETLILIDHQEKPQPLHPLHLSTKPSHHYISSQSIFHISISIKKKHHLHSTSPLISSTIIIKQTKNHWCYRLDLQPETLVTVCFDLQSAWLVVASATANYRQSLKSLTLPRSSHKLLIVCNLHGSSQDTEVLLLLFCADVARAHVAKALCSKGVAKPTDVQLSPKIPCWDLVLFQPQRTNLRTNIMISLASARISINWPLCY